MLYSQGIMQHSFAVPQALWAPPVHPSLPQTLADTILLTAPIVLPFPEACVVGIIQCVAFADWLLFIYAFKSFFKIMFCFVFLWKSH